jgi:hypothetical protein
VQRMSSPQSVMEYRALLQRRSELGDQLTSAQGRRSELASQLRTADAGSRPGIEARLKVLDERIIRLEQDLDVAGQAIANASPEVLAAMRRESASEIPVNIGNRMADEIVPIAGMFSVFFLLPVGLAFARLLWKRGSSSAPARPAISDAATTQRLEQLQHSMDAIAVEVERISEGQRYVAKLFSEKERPAIRA